MNYWFVVGTAAELIKIYPLIVEAQKRNFSWRLLQTGQSSQNFWKQVNDFGISPSQVITLNPNKEDLRHSFMALRWFLLSFFVGIFKIRSNLIKQNAPEMTEKDYFIVHGDTLSTLIGTLYGRMLGLKVVHVEAGMRSHCWHSPFPEELVRRMVSRLAHIHMAPDENAKNNLEAENIKKNVIVTQGNTIVDSLELVIKNSAPPEKPYVLANVHRFENLQSKERWNQIVDLLIEVSKNHHLIFVLMPNTLELLNKDQKSQDKLKAAGIDLRVRMPFQKFSLLLHGAEFVLTDGGSNQQECHYLGKPCLVLRSVTESQEGINGSCVLAKFDKAIINDFLSNYKSYKRAQAFPSVRPTEIIFRRLCGE